MELPSEGSDRTPGVSFDAVHSVDLVKEQIEQLEVADMGHPVLEAR